MKRLCTFGTVCALGMALSGCLQSPTAPAAGGHTFGSGNATAANFNASSNSGGVTLGSGNRTLVPGAPSDTISTADASGGAAVGESGDAAERGGYTIGSGN